MKKNKRILTGFLALTLTTAGYLVTGCENTPDQEVLESTYRIEYETFGGSNNEDNPLNYKPSDQTVSLKSAEKEGYIFAGWYTEATFENLINSIETGQKGHLKLYAKFVPVEYSISYELDGGVLDKANPTSYTIESANITINNPTKFGYTFLGWKDNENGVIVQHRRILKGTTGDKSYTALWGLTEYDISVTSAHGKVNVQKGANYNDEIEFEVQVDAGYEIEKITINDVDYPDDTREFVMPSEDVELVVHYKLIPYVIEYELDGGVNSIDNPDVYTYESQTIELYHPYKEGSTFIGWKDNETQEITSNVVIEHNSTGNKSYTAIWSANSYVIYVGSSYGDVLVPNSADYGTVVEFDIVPTPGYKVSEIIIDGNSVDVNTREFVMPDHAVYMEVWYECEEYDITYELYGGEHEGNPSSYSVSTGLSLNNPYKDGYVFVGWYEDENFTIPYNYDGKTFKSLTLHARFAQVSAGEEYFTSLSDAIENANNGDVINLLVDMEIDETLIIDKNITLSGMGVTVSASENFVGRNLIEINSGYVIIDGLSIDAEEKARVIKVSGGHLSLVDSYITGGYVDSYVSGVYVTGKATFSMEGGAISGNYIGHTGDYLEYATDLWIGSQASGIVASIGGDSSIGNVFINANSYQSDGFGTLSMHNGYIENVYVEYDDSVNKYATFNYVGGSVNSLHLSTTTTGEYSTLYSPAHSIYYGGHFVRIDDVHYADLMSAIEAANEDDEIVVYGDVEINGEIILDKNITIAGENGSTIYAGESFDGESMFVINDEIVIFDNIVLNGNEKARVLKVNSGHLILNDVEVTEGYADTYGAGVYVTGDASVEINDSEIYNNVIGHSTSHLVFATDMWISSEETNAVVINGESQVGSAFVDAKRGALTLADGYIDSVYLEYDNESNVGSTLNYDGGEIYNLYISSETTGEYAYVNVPAHNVYYGGYSVENNGTYYMSINDAVENAKDGETIKILAKQMISEPIYINKNLTIEGISSYQSEVSANNNFIGNAMFIIENGNVNFENITLNGKEVTRVLRANAGHLSLVNTNVTGGYVDSYVSGVYITGKATFSMDGGSITGNNIGHTGDYLEYATDLWIGSQASGTVASINGNAQVGNIFINSNSYRSDGCGVLTLNGGYVNNVYVEYDDEADTFATFNYVGGLVDSLHVSSAETGKYSTVVNPAKGSYYGGYVVRVNDSYYSSLNDAVNDANANDRVIVQGPVSIKEPIITDKNITIVSENNSLVEADKNFNGNAMFIVNGGTLTLEDINISGNNVARIVRANAGHLSLVNTNITSGYVDSYVSGVYITGKATFSMDGGSIAGNNIGHTGDYLVFATDLWIGSQASGTVASINGNAQVGNIFINSNSYKSDGNGVLTLNGGFVDTVYVEYDDEANTFATFNYIDGVVSNVYLSSPVTGTYVHIPNADRGVYYGGHSIEYNGNYYKTLEDAIKDASDGETIRVQANQIIEETIIIDKNITIAGVNNIGTELKAVDNFEGESMIVVKANVTFDNIILNGNYNVRVLSAEEGHLSLINTNVICGYTETYGSGVHLAGSATLSITGGSISENIIGYDKDYLMFATDLWIESQAGENVAVIDGEAQIGNVFIDSNAHQTDGVVLLKSGRVNNIYVEYDDENKTYGTFNYIGGTIDNLHVSTAITGNYVTLQSAEKTYYYGGHSIKVGEKHYVDLNEAIQENEKNEAINIYRTLLLKEPIITTTDVIIISQTNASIVASYDFVGNAMFIVNGGRLAFEHINLNGNDVARIVRANAGHLSLFNTNVTGGYVDSYVSGVYITGKATFSMDGGSITGNNIGHAGDYLEYATDLWIGSQASGTVASINGNAQIGNIFINSNSYKSDGNGVLTLNGGLVDTVYVEYDDEANTFATFNYIDGVVNNLYVSSSTTGKYKTISSPEVGTYYGGHVISVNTNTYTDLESAIDAANDNDTIVIGADINIVEPIITNKTLRIISADSVLIEADKAFVGNAMFIVNGGTLTLENLNLSGNGVARVIRANAGHLSLVNTNITNGYVDSYVSGVYITGKATFSMDGGSITGNNIGHTGDYLEYATDLWIGSQASGTVASINGNAQIGYVFVNSNSFKSDGNGVLTLNGGYINNVYVEYDDEANTYATFNYVGGVIDTLCVSTTTTGTFRLLTNPEYGTYLGGE